MLTGSLVRAARHAQGNSPDRTSTRPRLSRWEGRMRARLAPGEPRRAVLERVANRLVAVRRDEVSVHPVHEHVEPVGARRAEGEQRHAEHVHVEGIVGSLEEVAHRGRVRGEALDRHADRIEAARGDHRLPPAVLAPRWDENLSPAVRVELVRLLREWCLDTLAAGPRVARGYVQPEHFALAQRRLRAGEMNAAGEVWQLVTIVRWLDRNQGT